MRLLLVWCVFGLVPAVMASTFDIPILPHDSPAVMTLLISSDRVYTTVTVSVIENGTIIQTSDVVLDDLNNFVSTFSVEIFPVLPTFPNTTLEPSRIRAQAMDTFEIQVYTLANGHTEGYYAVPQAYLGREYLVSSFCALGGFCQLAILPVQTEATQVYIKFPPEVTEVSVCVGDFVWDSSMHNSLNITFPEVFIIETAHRITGTYIYADGPIGVVVGSRSISQSNRLYHVSEQLLPTSQWGKHYQILSSGVSDYGDVIQIVACQSNTVVEMEGYPNVVLPFRGAFLERRLPRANVALIQTKKPVQVAVIVGVSYMSSNQNNSSIAMAMLPATEAFKNVYETGMFGGTGSVSLAYKTTIPSLSGANVGTTTVHSVVYSEFPNATNITFHQINPHLITFSSAEKFGGLLSFGSALLPLEPLTLGVQTCVTNQVDNYPGDQADNDCDGLVDEHTCRENVAIVLDITDIHDVNKTTLSSHTVRVFRFAYINVRVLTCGVATLRFTDAVNNTVFIQISHGLVTFTVCLPICRSTTHIFAPVTSSQCDRDLVTYSIYSSGSLIFLTHGFDTKVLHFTDLPASLRNLTFGTLDTNSSIWYDLIYPDCAPLSTDWRCHDLATNCVEYEQDICNDATYQTWSGIYCRKYCRICSPDSFGRLFVGVPYPGGQMNVSIMSIEPSTEPLRLAYSEAVYGREDYTYISTGDTFSHTKLAVEYGMSIHLISTVDVHVTAIIKNFGKVTLQPVDALGMTYMTLLMTESGIGVCSIVPPSIDTSIRMVTRNESTQIVVASPGEVIDVNLPSSLAMNAVLFKTSKPVAIFCGVHYEYSYISWYQLSAVETWGRRYVTPSYDITNVTWTGKIRILTNSANTFFNISGGFDGVYALDTRGDFQDFTFDPNNTLVISSNNPVAVGIQYFPSVTILDDTTSVFQFLRPSEQYMESSKLFLDFPSTNDQVINVINDHQTDTTVYHNLVTNLSSNMYVYTSNESQRSFISVLTNDTQLVIVQSSVLFTDLSQVACRLTIRSPGDGLDNDCDGLYDEDICTIGYGSSLTDNDIDGAFGEDCSTIINGNTILYPPERVWCADIDIPSEGCWEICRCTCSWVSSLQEYDSMNETEQQKYIENKTSHLVKVLTVEKESLSATHAKLESANDERASSTNIGFAGIGMIVLVVGIIFFLDVIGIARKVNIWRQTSVSNQSEMSKASARTERQDDAPLCLLK